MLSMVGLDQQTGTQRYTFGMLDLWDGVRLVPVTIGLFGIGEIVDLWVKQTAISQQRVGKIGGAWQGCRDVLEHGWLTLRCSLLGTIIGIIPGLGGGSQWMVYAHTVQSSKDQSRFGKGDVRGVIGPGAAMNAKEGGNLVTTVAFWLIGSCRAYSSRRVSRRSSVLAWRSRLTSSGRSSSLARSAAARIVSVR